MAGGVDTGVAGGGGWGAAGGGVWGTAGGGDCTEGVGVDTGVGGGEGFVEVCVPQSQTLTVAGYPTVKGPPI